MTVIYAALRLLALLVLAPAALSPQALAASSRWQPPQRLTWYWQLQGSIDNSYPVAAYDIDGFDTRAPEVATLHAAGKRVICYIDVGTWENWRPDAAEFPSSVLGADNGWPGERWLDIRQLSMLEPIMTARLKMCKEKGFDAVEPDNIDGYENDTGFPISAQNQLTYDEWVAQAVHSLGMAVFQKNDPDQVSTLAPYFDGALVEQCNEYSECSSFRPYLSAGKPVLDAEYEASLDPGFCSADINEGIMGALYDVGLDAATYKPCWDRTNPVVGIAAGKLTINQGALGVRLSCPSGQSFCDGTVALDTVRTFLVPSGVDHRIGPRPLVLGTKHFHLAGGQAVRVDVKLSRALLGKLGNARSTGVAVEVTARDAGGRRASSKRSAWLVLRAPRQ